MLKFDLDEFDSKKIPDDQIEVVETDSPTFNKMLGGGLRTGNLYVLQAKSGEGKTTFMMRLFIKCLLAGKKAAFISAGEQSAKEIICRIACMYCSISYESYEFDNTDEQCKRINNFVEKYKDLMYVYYSEDLLLVHSNEEGQKTNDFKEFFIEMKKESIKFVFLDYLGAIYSNTVESQYSFLRRVAAHLKNKCTDNNIMIFTATQTNRLLPPALKEPNLDLTTVDQTYMQDSIGPWVKASCCLSLFTYFGKTYINIFKNRTVGRKGEGVFQIVIRDENYHYDWYEPGEWDLE